MNPSDLSLANEVSGSGTELVRLLLQDGALDSQDFLLIVVFGLAAWAVYREFTYQLLVGKMFRIVGSLAPQIAVLRETLTRIGAALDQKRE